MLGLCEWWQGAAADWLEQFARLPAGRAGRN